MWPGLADFEDYQEGHSGDCECRMCYGIIGDKISPPAVLPQDEYVEPDSWLGKCRRIEQLEKAIRETLEENAHLADGENCTLIKLKKVIGQA